MLSGIDLIDKDDKVLNPFKLPIEQCKFNSLGQKKRKNESSSSQNLKWRPFQIGLLLCLCKDYAMVIIQKEIFDLLWFPTGGGKTEAYLLIIAFNLFL